MATYTDKYRLKKPGAEDFADIADINANMDKIDETLGNKADLDESGKVPTEQLPDLGSDLELGETAESAYRGDRGKIAYDHSQTKVEIRMGQLQKTSAIPITKSSARKMFKTLLTLPHESQSLPRRTQALRLKQLPKLRTLSMLYLPRAVA